jgi:PAS domain S-box-containing protein
VASSADAIIGKTLDGIVTSWNGAAERMFGYSTDEMIGQSIRRLVPSERQGEEDLILSRIARSESIERHEMPLLARNGRVLDASLGWTSSADVRQQVRLLFGSKAEAIAYCEQNGLPYRVFEPAPPKRVIQNYADNFAYTQRVPWTH